MPATMNQKERAKQVIVEIIRQAGGEFHNKTNLFKSFWKAHLDYAQTNPGYLSGWPIVRMPQGPGIDRFDELLGELLADGLVTTEEVQKGPFEGFVFRLVEPLRGTNLPPAAVEAIGRAVQSEIGKTARRSSDDSHLGSPSWRSAKDGEELNIYLDLEDAPAADAPSDMAELLRRVWG